MKQNYGYNEETKTWNSYEDFFAAFADQVEFKDREKATHHLYNLSLEFMIKPNTILTEQEYKFICSMLKTDGKPWGEEVGQPCNRFGCHGTIYSKADEDMSCNCHNFAPCSKCTAGVYCPECDWDSDEDN